MNTSLTLPHPFLQQAHQALLDLSPHATLVGGAVRDMLLQRPVHDLDYVIRGDALVVGRKLADNLGAAYYPLDESRKIARIVWPQANENLVIDIASLIGLTLEEDIRRRDFTINAIAMRADGSIYDLLGGVQDLEQKILRPCSSDSLYNDPVRTLRAVRFMYTFGLKSAPGLEQLMWYAASRLHLVSPERLRDELLKIMALPQPHLALEQLTDWRIADEILPELVALQEIAQPWPHAYDAYRHSLNVLGWMSRLDRWLGGEDLPGDDAGALIQQHLQPYRADLRAYVQAALSAAQPRWVWVRFAALTHDWGKARSFREDETGKIHFYGHEELSAEMVTDWMQRYHCAKSEINFVRQLCRQHMRVMGVFINEQEPSRRAIFRFYRDLGDTAPAAILLFLADFLGARDPQLDLDELERALMHMATFLQPFAQRDEKPPVPAPLLNGNDIIACFDTMPGPIIGKLLRALQEAQAAGEVEDRDQAIGYLENLLNSPTFTTS